MQEIVNRKEEFNTEVFDTIYFGGGTPSILSVDEIIRIIDSIYRNYRIADNPEVTFEANPDDLTEVYLNELKQKTPINRLSIGIQSFHNVDLLLMNRRHTSEEAINSIHRARNCGFNNINIDLIYGIPGMNAGLWQQNLEVFGSLDLEHLSAYHLTFEPKTVFSKYQKIGKLNPIDEENSIKQFEILLGFADSAGYDHYEISNFAKEGYYSRHNLAYWTGKPYLGIGPSAHSFYHNQRRYNIRNNVTYINSLLMGDTSHFETEVIDLQTSFNEYILISLRTKWGINLPTIQSKFGSSYVSAVMRNSEKFVKNGTLIVDHDNVLLSPEGKFIADYVISELMIVE